MSTLYVGLNFTWRCDVELPGNQLVGVRAVVEWRRPDGSVLNSDNRITVGDVAAVSYTHLTLPTILRV